MGILLTFELIGNDTQKIEVAGLLDARGYEWYSRIDDTLVQLPDNSVFHVNRTSSEAISDFIGICETLLIKYKSAFATELLDPAFAPNIPEPEIH